MTRGPVLHTTTQVDASSSRTIEGASTTNVFAIVVFASSVKAIGAAKSALCARTFGIGRDLDCFLVAFALASVVCDTLSGALTAALIPYLAESHGTIPTREAVHVYGGILYLACGTLALIATLLVVSDTYLYPLVASGFSQSDLAATHKLLLLMLPVLPASAAIAVFRAVLNSAKRFALVASAPVLTPAAVIAAMFLGSHRYGISTLGTGTVAGVLAELILLAYGVKRLGYSVFPRNSLKLPGRWFFRQYLPLLASNLVAGTRVTADQAVAATLGPGSVSALNLGTRLVGVLAGIGPGAVSTVLLPDLSRLAAARNWTGLRRRAMRVAASASACGCALAVVFGCSSKRLAYLVFQKGTALHLNVPLLAHIQAISLIQLPFAFLFAVLTRTALAQSRNSIILVTSVVTAVFNLVLDLICVRQLGVAGLALSTTLVYALACLLLFPVLIRTKPHRCGFTAYLHRVCNKVRSSVYAYPEAGTK